MRDHGGCRGPRDNARFLPVPCPAAIAGNAATKALGWASANALHRALQPHHAVMGALLHEHLARRRVGQAIDEIGELDDRLGRAALEPVLAVAASAILLGEGRTAGESEGDHGGGKNL